MAGRTGIRCNTVSDRGNHVVTLWHVVDGYGERGGQEPQEIQAAARMTLVGAKLPQSMAVPLAARTVPAR
jgi:hypothetical protein